MTTTMTATDVIEAYVTDVALQLPRAQRSDVAIELRALLTEELESRSRDEGRAADAAMALALVRAFGRPAEVAGRYRPAVHVIDPGDGRAFVRATVIGLAVLWALGAIEFFQHVPKDSLAVFLTALGQFMAQTTMASFWWPGLLVAVFGASQWTRAHRADAAPWSPRGHGDAITGGRIAMIFGIVGVMLGLALLMQPHVILDVFWGGHAAPEAYRALSYTDTFLHRQAPFLFLSIAANVPLMLAVIAEGRWTRATRRAEVWLGLFGAAIMTWTVLDGPAFASPASDGMFKVALVVVVVSQLIGYAVTRYRRVRTLPERPIAASR